MKAEIIPLFKLNFIPLYSTWYGCPVQSHPLPTSALMSSIWFCLLADSTFCANVYFFNKYLPTEKKNPYSCILWSGEYFKSREQKKLFPVCFFIQVLSTWVGRLLKAWKLIGCLTAVSLFFFIKICWFSLFIVFTIFTVLL